MPLPGPDFDAIWKEIFMGLFHDCMERFDPAFARKIDRSRKVRFLDKELRTLLGRSPRPRQHVDFLAEVPLTGVGPDTMLTHVEVQRDKVAQFAQRMLFYHAALVRRFRQPVMSLAILAERVMRRHRNDPVARREGKLRLFGRMAAVLTSKGYGEEQQQVLTRVLDWSIPLPEDEERIFLEQLRQQEGDNPMTYLTTFERHARREGLEQGLEQGRQEGRREGQQDGVRLGWVEALKASASVRFPDWEPSWDRILEAVDDPDLLRVWHRLLLTAPSGAAFLKAIGKQPR